jgi:hypothetical protein
MAINKFDPANRWLVGSTPIYEPSAGVTIQHENIAGSSSGRTEDGIIHIDWVRRDVRKIGIKWSVMNEDELNYIIDLMQGKEYQFTFPDRGKLYTMDAYSSNCSYTMHTYANGTVLYTDVSINVIER